MLPISPKNLRAHSCTAYRTDPKQKKGHTLTKMVSIFRDFKICRRPKKETWHRGTIKRDWKAHAYLFRIGKSSLHCVFCFINRRNSNTLGYIDPIFIHQLSPLISTIKIKEVRAKNQISFTDFKSTAISSQKKKQKSSKF